MQISAQALAQLAVRLKKLPALGVHEVLPGLCGQLEQLLDDRKAGVAGKVHSSGGKPAAFGLRFRCGCGQERGPGLRLEHAFEPCPLLRPANHFPRPQRFGGEVGRQPQIGLGLERDGEIVVLPVLRLPDQRMIGIGHRHVDRVVLQLQLSSHGDAHPGEVAHGHRDRGQQRLRPLFQPSLAPHVGIVGVDSLQLEVEPPRPACQPRRIRGHGAIGQLLEKRAIAAPGKVQDPPSGHFFPPDDQHQHVRVRRGVDRTVVRLHHGPLRLMTTSK
ncbi:MAG: hypothetical protein A2V98_22220 [Planctomycetes bacterium RBG_16_64_12]|nr:MAG: hypothetical protein A2V98_22220 [Planctomycetes bacterium RBG_16_64_12]